MVQEQHKNVTVNAAKELGLVYVSCAFNLSTGADFGLGEKGLEMKPCQALLLSVCAQLHLYVGKFLQAH